MQSKLGYRLVRLANGAYSIHSLAHGETFHPVIGPTAEAEALYVRQLGLRERVSRHGGEFVIWDVGLGAAANALTGLRAIRDLAARVRLVSFDETIEPLRFALRHVAELGYLAGYEQALAQLMTDRWIRIREHPIEIEWQLCLADFPTFLSQPVAAELPKPHAILFDAYSPARNPAMWTLPLFSRLYQHLDPERPCALPTYSRSTMLRVTLLLAGFFVGVGHATGEKEETTIAANTLDLIAEPLGRAWLRRAHNSTSAEPMREPVYGQAPLSPETWETLQSHRQFH